MYHKATSIFYALSGFLLLTAFFILQPSNNSEVAVLQNHIKQELNIAWQQTIGDQSYFIETAEVYNAVTTFYNEATQSTLSLLTQPETDEDVIYVFHAVFSDLAQIFNGGIQKNVAEAKDIIEVPESSVVPAGKTAGASIDSDQIPANLNQPWVTLQDNMTGQKYCLAIYNGFVNKYLGVCNNDYH